jgi:hypothetical protein
MAVAVVYEQNLSRTYRGSPLYVSPSTDKVEEALLEEFPDKVKKEVDGRLLVENWDRDYKVIGEWLVRHYCGYGCNNNWLSIHPMTVVVL